MEAHLEAAYAAVEQLGMPLALAAWLTVFASSIGVASLLRTRRPARWGPALTVGLVALGAHLLDYFVTLRMSPTLDAEANPIWRIVIDSWGLSAARLYGLSGKIFVAILSFELFALYEAERSSLYPEPGMRFRAFWRHFGTSDTKQRIHWRNLASFFAFSFALLGPFFFYIAFLNSLSNDPLYLRFPPMPVVLLGYLGVVAAAYFLLTYRAYVRCPGPEGQLPSDRGS